MILKLMQFAQLSNKIHYNLHCPKNSEIPKKQYIWIQSLKFELMGNLFAAIGGYSEEIQIHPSIPPRQSW